MNQKSHQPVRLDLNNPVFQRQLFKLSKSEQPLGPEPVESLQVERLEAEGRNILNTLRKLANMTWQQVYIDHGIKWEAILSKKGPGGEKLYSFRIGSGFRGVAYRDGLWLRILSLHPDHDSAYR